MNVSCENTGLTVILGFYQGVDPAAVRTLHTLIIQDNKPKENRSRVNGLSSTLVRVRPSFSPRTPSFYRLNQLIILNYYFSELHWIAHLKSEWKWRPLPTSVLILSPTQVTVSRREISPHLPRGVPESQWCGLLCASPSLPLHMGMVPTQYVYHVGTNSLSSLQASEWREVTSKLEADHNGLWTKALA